MYFTDAELERCRMANEIHDLKRELDMNSDVLADVEDDAKKYRSLIDATPVDPEWLTKWFGSPHDGGHYREWICGSIVCGRDVTIFHDPASPESFRMYLQDYLICNIPTRGNILAFLFGAQSIEGVDLEQA